jgi:hypothetical protein
MLNKLKQSLQNRLDPFPYRRYTNKYKCIFIHIPKAAGTSILKAIGDGKVQRDHASYSDYMKSDPVKFENYFKFTFTRNPWDRIASAYFYLKKGGNNSEADLALSELFNSKYSSFERFVLDYLDEDKLSIVTMFRTQSSFICDAQGRSMMDYTGKFENIAEDYEKIASQLSIPNKLEEINVINTQKKHYSGYYSNTEMINKIKKLYKNDCEEFGYKYEKK